MGKKCFVISAIGKNESRTRTYADEKFDLIFKPILEEMGYTIIRSDKISSPSSISREIVENLIESEVVIADVSTDNPNVFYELAIRNAIKKPVIIIKRPNQTLPFDIYDKRAILVSRGDPRIWEAAKKQLKTQVKFAEDSAERASESIVSDYAFDVRSVAPKTDLEKVQSLIKDLHQDVRRLDKKISPEIRYTVHCCGSSKPCCCEYRHCYLTNSNCSIAFFIF